jgi:phosphoribosylaminoimidazolecarboxamide formyltransferase/IMP cyclohydrolase
MVRAAAKNHASVAVVTSPSMYPAVTRAAAAGGFTLAERRRLAAQAFAHTARYDVAVASWFASAYAPDETAAGTGWPDVVGAVWSRQEVLRYGENPHQRAARYTGTGPPGLASARQLQGKAMSYNNYVDAAAAWRAVSDFGEPCVAIVKHTNPCGIAVGGDLAEAHRKAHACDPVSAYGGVIAANGAVTGTLASQIAGIFTEVVVAPGFEPAALELLASKANLRLLACPPPGPAGATTVEWRPLGGGLLMQTADLLDAPGDDPSGWQLRTGPAVTAEVLADLAFAWRACRSVKSNAIVIAAGGATVGVGMGQVNRVDSARLAVTRAGDRARGAVAASDAFFPFADGLEVLASGGVQAIVEPGGSVRDDEVVAAASKAGVSLYFTGARHFFH